MSIYSYALSTVRVSEAHPPAPRAGAYISYTAHTASWAFTHPYPYGILRTSALSKAYTVWFELFTEWPELGSIAAKILSNKPLREPDIEWIREISVETGWDYSDIVDELRNITADPSKRATKYYSLYNEYFKKALDYYEKNDLRQAGEKLYASVLALIKYYAAVKGIPVLHWSRGRIERFITNNVESDLKEPLRTLLSYVQVLHEHFYEAYLDEQSFRERWNTVLKLLKQVEEQVIARARKHLHEG